MIFNSAAYADPPARPAAAAAVPQSSAPAAASTLPEVVVEAPEPRYAAPTTRDRIGRICAPVFINGEGPFRLVLDTGANRSAVIASVADQLHIPIRALTLKLHGVTGTATVPSIHVDRLQVGDLELPGETLPVVADVFGGAQGVLGNEGFTDRRILIDFGHDRVTILRSHGTRAAYGFTSVPLKIVDGRLLAVAVRLGGMRVKAIIDTGAQQTVGNIALRDTLARRRLAYAKSQDIEGVTLDIAKGQSVATPPITFNGLEIDNLRVTFGSMPIFDYWKLAAEPALLIGMDVLGSLDTVIIDYKLHELQLRPRIGSGIYH